MAQTRLRQRLDDAYTEWHDSFHRLGRWAPPDLKSKVQRAHEFVTNWIGRKREGPSSEGLAGLADDSVTDERQLIEAAKARFRERTEAFRDFLRELGTQKEQVIIVVPDMNALLREPDFTRYSGVLGSDRYTVVLVPTVLDELDKMKYHPNPEVRCKAKRLSRRLKGLRAQARDGLVRGTTVNKTVSVRFKSAEPDFGDTLRWLDETQNDDRILASALEEQYQNPTDVVVLVTGDLNLQNKAEAAFMAYAEPPKEPSGDRR